MRHNQETTGAGASDGGAGRRKKAKVSMSHEQQQPVDKSEAKLIRSAGHRDSRSEKGAFRRTPSRTSVHFARSLFVSFMAAAERARQRLTPYSAVKKMYPRITPLFSPPD